MRGRDAEVVAVNRSRDTSLVEHALERALALENPSNVDEGPGLAVEKALRAKIPERELTTLGSHLGQNASQGFTRQRPGQYAEMMVRQRVR